MRKIITLLFLSLVTVGAGAQSIYTDHHILRDSDLPAGQKLERYGIAGYWYNNPMTGITADSYFGKVKNIYEADNGDVYIYEPVFYLSTNSWIRAEKAEGDTLVVNLPQVIDSVHYGAGELGFNSPDSTVYYYADHLTLTKADDDSYTYTPSTDHKLKFTYKNGTLSQVLNDDGSCELLGVVDSKGAWAGCGDFYIERRPQTDTVVTLPDDAQPIDYTMSYQKDDDYSEETTVTLYRKADTIYYRPESDYATGWVKGTIKDGKLTFGVQYLGKSFDGQAYTYFVPATVTTEVDEDWGMVNNNYQFKSDGLLTFDVTGDGDVFAADSGFVVNTGKEKFMNDLDYPHAVAITFTKVQEQASTPNDPEIIYAPEWNDSKDYGTFTFYADEYDNEGNDMNPNKLFYNIYFDDDTTPFTFTTAQYGNDFTEDVTDVPWRHSSPNLFASGNTREINFFNKDVKRIGVQMIYRGAGEEHRSNIVWSENTSNGINDIKNSTKSLFNVYTINGRKVMQNAKSLKGLQKGLYIVNGTKYVVK